MEKLSEAGRAAKNDYMRQRRSKLSKEAMSSVNNYQQQWRKKHPEKISEYNASYWQRVAERSAVTDSVTDKISVTDSGISCVQCGGAFIAKRSDSKFCSPGCKQKFHRSKKP